MAHSVVKVTDDDLSDRLLLVVDPDGTVTPDKETVQTYLKSKPDGTHFEVMHVNKVNEGDVDLSLETYTYVQNEDVSDGTKKKTKTSALSLPHCSFAVPTGTMDEISRNLYYFRMDHDYTPLTSPKHENTSEKEHDTVVDELAHTLGLLDGCQTQIGESKVTMKSPVRIIKKSNLPVIINSQAKLKPKQTITYKSARFTKIVAKEKVQDVTSAEEQEESFEEEINESQDDDNDSDFEMENVKQTPRKRVKSSRSLSSEGKIQLAKVVPKIKSIPANKTPPTTPKVDLESIKMETTPEKKLSPQKKEKKVIKPILDDFALFSTPDIIRRVGGKSEPESPKALNEGRQRLPSIDGKMKRLSTDTKQAEKTNEAKPIRQEIRKSKELDPPSSLNKPQFKKEIKERRSSGEVQRIDTLTSQQGSVSIQEFHDTSGSNSSQSGMEPQLEPLPNTEDIQSIIGATSAVFNTTQDLNQLTESLDLDQSILDNIGTDLISEDILYQVAQSLAGNTELQNVMELSNVDGNLVLDAPLPQECQTQEPLIINANEQIKQIEVLQAENADTGKGTQIVRPDGRIVVIPPIERPTTRSRNKRTLEPEVKEQPPSKVVYKPLDEEHVSSNELDSSSDKDDEEDEDDPDKLWCICNQPHNNRFMICCDTCEEWYHGKCVNVTKAMGQLMENEGKEWICLFCKDASLKRPEAAARRIRKASRTSTDSSSSQRKSASNSNSTSSLTETKPTQPACIVCGKPSRVNSIYCSDGCILKHAQGVEKVVVFERKTGKILSGTNAPNAANLEKWLQEHPGFEAVRSTTNNKPASGKVMQSKLKIVKNVNNESVSLALQRKGVNLGILQHAPKDQPIILNKHINNKKQMQITGLKIISKQINTTPLKTKVIHALPINKPQTPTSTTPKPKPIQTTLKVVTPTNKEKSPQQKVVRNKSSDTPPTPTPPKQENIRENVRKTLFEQLTNRLKMVDDLKLTEDEINSISTEIESQLYKCFGDTSQKYRNKYRSLIFNIKDVKNQTLWRRICEKSINPYQLVRLSSDDLASQELALWREQTTKRQLDMIKKSELELLNCNRQYVFKTHKGEQVFEDDRPKETVDSTEVITSLTSEGSNDDTKRSSSKEREKKSLKHSKRDRERGRSKDRDRSRDRSRDSRSSKDKDRHRKWSKDRERHKRSRSRERSKQDKKRTRSSERERHRRSSHKSSKHKKENHNTTDKLSKKSKELLKQLVDKQILQPLEDGKQVIQEDIIPSKSPTVESESDHEPTSTVTIPTPPQNTDADTEESSKSIKSPPQNDSIQKSDEEKPKNITTSPSVKEENSRSPTPKILENPIWTGVINMVDVAQISITAHEVSGDCSGLGVELSQTLDIVGRIAPETVWDYIGKMKCSNSKMISLLRLHANNVEEQMPYIALYSYLSSRKRLGVVKSTNKAVKDFYILPLSNQKPIPQALLPISGPGFEESRPPLLLGIIVRDKRKRPAAGDGSYTLSKRLKTEAHAVQKGSTPPRSYTPPPTRDPRMKVTLPLPSTTKKDLKEEDMDEPYSPEDSDPDTGTPVEVPTKISSYLDTGITTQILEPFTNKFDTIPGLEDTSIPITNLELQRKMAELDQQIAMEKAVIDNMSQDIASSAGTEIGASAYSNIALPSNLQQILDSIKTIGPTNMNTETNSQNESSDLTIPLMLPKISSRTQGSSTSTNIKVESPSSSSPTTIPLKLPKLKTKTPSALQSPNESLEKVTQPVNSVLSSLTEEDLIRKAAEMLGESDNNTQMNKKMKDTPTYQPTPTSYITALQNSNIFNQPPPNLNTPPPLLNTPPPLLNTPPPLLNTAPSLLNTAPSLLNTQPPLLNTTNTIINAGSTNLTTTSTNIQTNVPPPTISSMNLNSLSAKRSKIDLNQPPIPGLEDET